MFFFQLEIIIDVFVRGFVRLKKIKKSEKNSEVGQAPTRICLFLGNLVFLVFFTVHVCKKNEKNG